MRKISPALSLAFGLAAAAAMPGQPRAATLTALVSFDNTDGEGPFGGVIIDTAGNLYGTTYGGGAYGHGTVFEIAKTTAGYANTPTVLYSFCPPFNRCSDGAFPQAGLLADAIGNLFGTTENGGAFGLTLDGTVFELAKTTGGYASTPTTLVSFNGANGAGPVGSLVADAAGNLFGATGEGGVCGEFVGCGTVFEIAKTAAGYASTPTTLVSFNGTNGMTPNSSVIIDTKGNLFGTTQGGGANNGGGTVFEIVKTATGYASTPTILYSFCAKPNCTDGRAPNGLSADTHGNLFGTTADGGAYGLPGYGTVFEIVKTRRGYASALTTIVSFNGADGEGPGSLIVDARGNLFGTTSGGGASADGTVFEIAKTRRSYASTPTIVASFNPTDGQSPFTGLTADTAGNLLGTAAGGGSHNLGTVFEITGSGFVPPAMFAGTPGTPRCIGTSVRRLARQYGGLHAAAAALDYASVRDLLNAIGAYCEV